MADLAVPAEDLPEGSPEPISSGGAVPQGDLPESSAKEVPASDLPGEDDSEKQEKYGTGTQQAIAGIEGLAKGVAGPLATGAERLLGVPAEDIEGRAEANPWTHGIGEAAGIGGSLLSGNPVAAYSEAAIIGKAAEGLSHAADLGKIGSTILKGAVEAGLFQGGDEISNAILGKADPETPVSSALAHMGAAALLGGAGGAVLGKAAGKLQELAEGKTAQTASQFMADFANRWKFKETNPDLTTAITDELTHFHGTTSAAADEVYGSSGLKAQAIQKLVPEMNENIAKQTQEIATNLQNKYSEMVADPDTYPPRLAKLFQKEVNAWMETATDANASSIDRFNATQELKQRLQLYSKFDKQISAIAPERGFVDAAKDISHQLRTALEDNNAWGQAADLQKGVNKAFTDFLPAQKDFLRKFTTKVEGEPVIDPGKIRTYVNQLGKPNAEIKQTMLKNYIDAAEKYRSHIDGLHASLGLESPLQPSSLNAVKETMNENPAAGAKFADWLSSVGINSFSNKVASTIGGAEVGAKYGGVKGAVLGAGIGHVLPLLEQAVGRKITQSMVPGIIKALASGEYSSVPKAMNYAETIAKGARKINSSVDNLFTIGGQKYLNHDFSETARENLKKYIEEGQMNQEMTAQSSDQPDNQAPVPHFAHGGEVIAPEPIAPVTKPVPKVLKSIDGVSGVFPEQSMLLGAAKGRINNYLNSVRPQSVQSKAPFDPHMPDKSKDKAYNKALNVALKPLSVVDHIKNGTLDMESMQHMQGMYPELANHLRQKISTKILDAQLKNEKPPYKVRQSLSLFMGSPMDSTFSPQNIMAAQNVFARQNAEKQQQQAPQPKKSGSTNKLSESPNQYRTADQSRSLRQSRTSE